MTRLPCRPRRLVSTVLTAAALLSASGARPSLAQHGHDHGAATAPPARPTDHARRGARISMDEMHRAGGVPAGWRFSWPEGDAAKGRDVFVKLECYQCHEVKGESFPAPPRDPTRQGPALAGMGDHHPAEYFAESVLDPNAVIVTGPGFTGPDGLSIMPDYRDSLTLAETIDLVAFIRSLAAGPHAHHDGPPERERVVGHYRVRLAYAGPGGHAHHGSGPATAAHLMVFVTDTTRGDPVPYLPVTATIHAEGGAPRVVRLSPMLGDRGFHYGADVAVPVTTSRIVVKLGAPTIQSMSPGAGRLAAAAEVSFEWGK